jgi:hypothetical protein
LAAASYANRESIAPFVNPPTEYKTPSTETHDCEEIANGSGAMLVQPLWAIPALAEMNAETRAAAHERLRDCLN